MEDLKRIRTLLNEARPTQERRQIFYKTGPGDYAEHDKFIGVSVPALRTIAKNFAYISIDAIAELLRSAVNEERFLALIILVAQYQCADDQGQEKIYQFYLSNLCDVNNWNLVDASAHHIIGEHLLLNKSRGQLLTFAASNVLWERRVAIVATYAFIKRSDLKWTFLISSLLLGDNHDLIHKAVGWMLREAGKRDIKQLIEFLDRHSKNMPRVMLRYAIEKFPEHTRASYLSV